MKLKIVLLTLLILLSFINIRSTNVKAQSSLHLFYLRGVDPTHSTPSAGDDIGALLEDQPNESEYRMCGSWVGYFYDDDSYTFYSVTKLYVRVWWKVELSYSQEIGYYHDQTRAYDAITDPREFYMNKTEDIIEQVDDKYLTVTTYYDMSCNVDTPYNFSVRFRTAGGAYEMWTFSSPKFQSFVLINFPSNSTLQSMDSDNDGISDYDELFVNYTNPLDNDTDNDGYNDSVDEYPNDYRKYQTVEGANSVEYTALSEDAYLYKADSDFGNARNASSSDGITNSTTLRIGYYVNRYDRKWYIYRTVLYFNTSSLPDDAEIKTATLKLYLSSVPSEFRHIIMIIINGQPNYPHKPPQSSDYNISLYDGNYSYFHTGQVNQNSYAEIPLTNVSLINKTGITKFMIVCKTDYHCDSPDERKHAYFDFASSETSTEPKLNITYDMANNPPTLTNPSAEPTSGVADYTIFYFNITYSDADGDAPTVIKVNISKTGWFINASMSYISGDNTTGALYSYSTTLPAGTYDYLFYASDGVDSTVNDPTDTVSVEAQDLSFTIYTSSGDSYINFTADVTPGQGLTTCYNVSAEGQDDTTPALKVVNTGNVPLNFTWHLLNDLPSGITLKYNYVNTPPNPGENLITTTEYQFATSVPVGGSNSTWMWMDFVNVQAGTGQETLQVNSTLG